MEELHLGVKGGGHKRLYRSIDFRRNRFGDLAKVTSIEYDPNRTAHIALIQYGDDEKSYILCPEGLSVGDEILSSDQKLISKSAMLCLFYICLWYQSALC